MYTLSDGRELHVRPLAVGDVRELGPAWPEALSALTRWAGLEHDHARLEALPEVITAMGPVLCRMTRLSPEEIDALDLAALMALLCAALEVNARPFARPVSTTPSPPPTAGHRR